LAIVSSLLDSDRLFFHRLNFSVKQPCYLGLAEKVKKTGAKYFVVEQPGETITFSLTNLLQSYLFLIPKAVSMSILIPDEILRATRMTEDELKLEIAIMLYKQEKISSGKVRAWTGLTVIEFQHELAKRGLLINYDVEDFQSDIRTLQSMELL
jgi:predicted HTH domain antitoxin